MVRLFVSWRLCPRRSDTLSALRWLADIISIDNMINIIRTWLIDTCHFLHQAVNIIQNFLTLPGPQTQKTKSKGNWRLTTRPHWRRQGYVAVCDPPLIQKVNALSLTKVANISSSLLQKSSTFPSLQWRWPKHLRVSEVSLSNNHQLNDLCLWSPEGLHFIHHAMQRGSEVIEHAIDRQIATDILPHHSNMAPVLFTSPMIETLILI